MGLNMISLYVRAVRTWSRHRRSRQKRATGDAERVARFCALCELSHGLHAHNSMPCGVIEAMEVGLFAVAIAQAVVCGWLLGFEVHCSVHMWMIHPEAVRVASEKVGRVCEKVTGPGDHKGWSGGRPGDP